MAVEGGFTSLSDVPDVPVSIDGSAAAGGLEDEDILATCPDAMTEEAGLLLAAQLQSCDAGEDRSESDCDSESLGLPLTLEEGLVLEGLEASEANSPQELRRGGFELGIAPWGRQ
ncbi:hypothetical protein AK812_SmicGene42915 [Symbiodinium microadriaticum]|uniref:Uncharacterized protein n=1 Tax=Symbiodinium microadriaticum TaxID=2951 RepID=A0A1Q9C2C1_SYMMI|nr:hypothetical protein AK812_SmicGene42915 [Symbiodinium microadriaticum]